MSEANLQRRFKTNLAGGKQIHSENSSKDLNNVGIYNLTEFDRDTTRHIEDMRNGANNILVSTLFVAISRNFH